MAFICRDEAKLIQIVLDEIQFWINSKKTLQHDLFLVGMKEHMNLCMKKLEKMSSATCALGLVGTGGIGKTLLVKMIYDHFVGHKKFQASMSFLEIDCKAPSGMKVGLRRLQKQLLWDLLSVIVPINKLGMSYTRLFMKISIQGPMLIVLDDIYDRTLFNELILDPWWLPLGICIIATFRDQHLLEVLAGKLNFYFMK